MRLMVMPIVLVGLLAGVISDEPSEREMNRAFAEELTREVQGALAYVEETGGREALQRVREAGTDRFALRSFTKFDCLREDAPRSYVCGFAVEIAVMNGSLRYSLTGRFVRGPGGFIFQHTA